MKAFLKLPSMRIFLIVVFSAVSITLMSQTQDKLLSSIEKLRTLSEELNKYPEVHYTAAIKAYNAHNLNQCLEEFMLCDEIRDKNDNYNITSNTNHWIAYILHLLNKDDKAIKYDPYYYLIEPEDLNKHFALLNIERAAAASKNANKVDEACALYLLCIDQAKVQLGDDHYFIAGYYNELAGITSEIPSKSNETISYYKKSVDILKKRYSNESIALQQYIQLNLSMKYFLWGNIEEAKKKTLFDTDVMPQNKAFFYFCKAFLLYNQDDNAALDVCMDYCKSSECLDDSIFCEFMYNIYLKILENNNNFEECIVVSKQYNERIKNTVGDSDVRYLNGILRTAEYCKKSGRLLDEISMYLSLESFFDKNSLVNVIQDFLTMPDKEHPLLNSLAKLYENIYKFSILSKNDEFSKFAAAINTSLSEYEWSTHVSSPSYSSVAKIFYITNCYLAQEQSKKGNYEEAIRLYEGILSTLKNKEIDNLNIYGAKANCGILYYENNNNAKAVEYIEDALHHKDDPDGIIAQNLAGIYAVSNPDNRRISELNEISYSKYKKGIISQLLKSAAIDREFYWNNMYKIRNDGYVSLPILCKGNNKNNNIIAYNALLLGKGFLLSTEKDVLKITNDSKDDKLKELLASINHLEEKLLSLPVESSQYTATLLEQTELNANLSKIAANDSYIEKYMYTYQDIRNNLSDNSIAIEFAYLPNDLKRGSDYSYYAFIARNNWDYPLFVNINLPKDFEQSPDLYTNSKWTDIIWKNIIDQAHITPGDSIYFAADRDFHAISIENLTYNDLKVPISSVYNMYRLSSTREICVKDVKVEPESIVLYGGLLYNEDTGNTASANREAESGLEYLPNTLKEIEEISTICKSNLMNEHVYCYIGSNGTEKSFHELSGKSPSILHLATHGTVLDMSNISSMERSVLFLSNSENSYFGENDCHHKENGIISAAEVSKLDFSATDFVVMSACNSGNGKISDDGVFGLQRGFKLAGVKSLLMSLQKVDDRSTLNLMSEFYTNWIHKKMSKLEALEKAKKTIRETKGWEDPKYWAAFILLDALN